MTATAAEQPFIAAKRRTVVDPQLSFAFAESSRLDMLSPGRRRAVALSELLRVNTLLVSTLFGANAHGRIC